MPCCFWKMILGIDLIIHHPQISSNLILHEKSIRFLFKKRCTVLDDKLHSWGKKLRKYFLVFANFCNQVTFINV